MTDQPWAKLARDDDHRITAALPLADHCLDVGAAMEAVLPAWRVALEAAAGRPLTDQDRARLAALAALHDIGKANRGFQARTDLKADRIGHTGPLASLLWSSTTTAHLKLPEGKAGDALWTIIEDWGAEHHLAAVMAHHGRPVTEFEERTDNEGRSKYARYWAAKDGNDPAAAIPPVVDAIRARWPLAWEPGPTLPSAPAFVALLAGLVTLADWLGSDTQRFPIEAPHGPDREPHRAAAARAAAKARGFAPLDTPDTDFQTLFGNPPYPFQSDAAAADLGPVALIEAETGSGKTEAALWRWLALRRAGLVDGLFFALPTRSAAVQLHARVDKMLRNIWGDDGPHAVLAVPGYLRVGDTDGQALPDYVVRWDSGEPTGAPDARWAAERANRFLAARVAVGTIDQALLGVLPVRHALFRAGVLSRSLLVVDEVHASDAYMTGLLDRLLTHHVAAGGHALLLSATLGAAARSRFLRSPALSQAEAEAVPYPALSGRAAPPRPVATGGTSKRVTIEPAGIIADPAAIAAHAIAAARAGAAVLVLRNSVADAVAVAQGIEALDDDFAFRVNGVATLHHGRFAPADRQRLDCAVETAFGKNRTAGGRILVGTQTLEQSLDIDADHLVTDLAPIDVLLQRIGRLHRHRRDDRGTFAAPRVLLLRPADRDLTLFIDRPAHGLGGHVYPDLLQIEATLRLLEEHPVITIPADNRRLVEGALHPERLDTLKRDLGTDWINYQANRDSATAGATYTAERVALDLSQPFRKLKWGDGEAAATRLGAQDLLLDLPEPLASPFEGTVDRLRIPHWMAGPGGPPERLDATRFRIGDRDFTYDRRGLRRTA